MDHTTKPGSPGDILEHYGKKGMRWGVVNEDKPSPEQAIARKNESEKRTMSKDLGNKKEQSDEKSGLSPTQKKAILAAGVGVVAIGGFVAYKHYAGGGAAKDVGELTDWGNPFPKKPDMSGLKTHRLSDQPLGFFGQKGENSLMRREGLALDISKGYADWVPKDGFANEHAAARHASITRAVEAMREKYPAIRNMHIEVAPMSHAAGHFGGNVADDAFATAGNLEPGVARILYNDVKGASKNNLGEFIPGHLDPDHLGTHEMGHVLAAAHGELFASSATRVDARDFSVNVNERFADFRQAEEKYHAQILKKHGFSFEETSKFGGYARTTPVEALAELSAYFHAPGLQGKLTAEQRTRAEALFNEMGGVK